MAKTVFVIGAGASFDFGLPTGEQLIDSISQFFGLLNSQYNNSQEIGLADEQALIEAQLLGAQKLLEVLERVDPDDENGNFSTVRFSLFTEIQSAIWLAKSIDNYINEQRDAATSFLGKFAIVESILRAEGQLKPPEEDGKLTGQVSLMPGGPSEKLNFKALRVTWLVPFFRELTSGLTIKELADRFKNISLIIFNYDRCVEHFLYNALIEYYRIDPPFAAGLMSKLKVVHPYGRLGALEWQKHGPLEWQKHKEFSRIIKFGNFNDVSKIPLAASRIKTFEEAVADKTINAAQNMVRESSIMVFLGFGFHVQNMEFLGSGENLFEKGARYRKIFATSYGLSNYKKEKVHRALQHFSNPEGGANFRHHVALENGTCRELIDEYGGDFFSF